MANPDPLARAIERSLSTQRGRTATAILAEDYDGKAQKVNILLTSSGASGAVAQVAAGVIPSALKGSEVIIATDRGQVTIVGLRGTPASNNAGNQFVTGSNITFTVAGTWYDMFDLGTLSAGTWEILVDVVSVTTAGNQTKLRVYDGTNSLKAKTNTNPSTGYIAMTMICQITLLTPTAIKIQGTGTAAGCYIAKDAALGLGDVVSSCSWSRK
jgi:hypothetical protein